MITFVIVVVDTVIVIVNNTYQGRVGWYMRMRVSHLILDVMLFSVMHVCVLDT